MSIDNNYFEHKLNEYNITKREKEIVHFIMNGFHDKEIAAKLNISAKTVSNHIRNIFEKSGVNNKIRLVIKLTQNYKYNNII